MTRKKKGKRKPKHPEVIRRYWREAQRRHRAKKKAQAKKQGTEK